MRPEQFLPSGFAAGAKHALELEFLTQDGPLTMPVLLVRGEQPGKTLVVSAGVHGDEYEGVQAIFDTFDALSPAAMTGSLLAVPVLNGPAHRNRSRSSPLDGANLARVFPGRPDGRATETIAWHFDQSILAHADFYLDLHSAGVNCLMPSMVGYDASDPRSREAALGFGSSVIWGHPDVPAGRTVSSAKARGIPFLYTEARGAGRIDPGDLEMMRRGIRNLMRWMRILPDEPERMALEWHLSGEGNIDKSLSASQPGFLTPKVSLLDRVAKGDELGVLRNLRGEILERFAAPCAGLVGLIHVCPVVEPGEPLFLICDEASGGA